MARIIPQNTDSLSNPPHAFLHRVITVDGNSTQSTIDIDGSDNTRIGTLADNHTKFDSTGHQTMEGTATVWDDLRVEPVIKAIGTHDPTFTQWFSDGSGSIGLFLYNFIDANTVSQKEVFFTVQLPHSWAGTAIFPHVHWIPDANQNNARPVWGLEYSWEEIGSVFGNSLIVYTTSLEPNDTNLVQYKHYISKFASISPSSSQNGISSVMICRLFRFSGDASDTFTSTCGLLYCDFHFEINSIGSNSEYIK